MYIPGTTYLHILLHCTLYLIAHLTPYFISLFVSYLILTIFVYIYTLSCFLFHSFLLLLCYFFFILLSCFIFLSCTFHWADLSRLTFHYLLYPVWLCMWQIIKNLEPWTLRWKESLSTTAMAPWTIFTDLFTTIAAKEEQHEDERSLRNARDAVFPHLMSRSESDYGEILKQFSVPSKPLAKFKEMY